MSRRGKSPRELIALGVGWVKWWPGNVRAPRPTGLGGGLSQLPGPIMLLFLPWAQELGARALLVEKLQTIITNLFFRENHTNLLK